MKSNQNINNNNEARATTWSGASIAGVPQGALRKEFPPQIRTLGLPRFSATFLAPTLLIFLFLLVGHTPSYRSRILLLKTLPLPRKTS